MILSGLCIIWNEFHSGSRLMTYHMKSTTGFQPVWVCVTALVPALLTNLSWFRTSSSLRHCASGGRGSCQVCHLFIDHFFNITVTVSIFFLFCVGGGGRCWRGYYSIQKFVKWSLCLEIYLFLSDVRFFPALLVTGQRSQHFLRSLLRGCHFSPLLSGSFWVLERSTVFKDGSHLSNQHQWVEKWYVSYEIRVTLSIPQLA